MMDQDTLPVSGIIVAMAGGATQAIDTLVRAGIDHIVHAYAIDDDCDLSYGEAVAAALGIDPRRLFKTLVTTTGSGFVVAIVPVSSTLSLKALARTVGSKKVAMADPTDAERVTGYVTGGISPFGRKKVLPVVVDSSLFDHDTVFVSAGRRGLQVELAPAAVVDSLGAEVAAIATG